MATPGHQTGLSPSVLYACRVAAHAVAEIADPFLAVLAGHPSLVVTGVAGVPAIVVARVASLAVAVGAAVVQRESVAERRTGPGLCRVAVAALAGIVVLRRVPGVTARTVAETGVIEPHLRPGRGAIVTVAALAQVVIDRRVLGMAA